MLLGKTSICCILLLQFVVAVVIRLCGLMQVYVFCQDQHLRVLLLLFVVAVVIRLHGLVQVKGLAFNQLSPNLLASGGADGDIIIWDVANPRKPTAFPPLKVSQKAIYYILRTLFSLPISWLSCIALCLILVRPTCTSKAPSKAKAALLLLVMSL